jgi:3-hydroxy acid dehydrogenase/malonic semialdehyde reductase
MASLTVFVTGASVGYGAATVRRFARDGAHVIAASRRIAKLEALQKELGENVLPLELDVTDRAAVEAVVTKLPPAFAEIDVLVNNAGLALGLGAAQQADMEDWEAMVDTNIKGVMYCTRAILPGMVDRKRGHVVNLGSVASEFPYPGGNVYGATKAFVHQFSLNLRADLLGTGVRVTDVAPGLTAGTEFSEVRFHGDKEKAAKVYEGTTPLTADDVADAIHWVATRPAHVNINLVQIMPTCQAFAPFAISRSS